MGARKVSVCACALGRWVGDRKWDVLDKTGKQDFPLFNLPCIGVFIEFVNTRSDGSDHPRIGIEYDRGGLRAEVAREDGLRCEDGL